ncbi:MAG: GAF domain-containing protein [Nocardioidaceae bacterium]
MTGFGAIAPGTDLSRHARELQRVHDAVIGGSGGAKRPRPLVSRSWERVLRAGLDPEGANARSLVGRGEVERRRHVSPLAAVIDDLLRVVSGVGDTSSLLMVVTDADGVILWRAGPARVRARADILGFAEGACWTEPVVGTNAIGTALAEAVPVQLFSAEHFEQTQHPWYCTASPVHDPRTGDLVGIVDVSGPALTLHPAVTALVETAVRLAESLLWQRHEATLERLRTSAQHVLATTSGPLLLVDDHGWVAHHAGIAVRRRIEVPRADRTLAVPGLGICLPERVAGGWLVRPATGDRAVRAVLDLSGSPVLEVHGRDEPWRACLGRRHADILLALWRAGSAGMSAGQLSTRLYGDADHAVSVRAEISRLRRVVGGLVETGPYRLSPQLTWTAVGVDGPAGTDRAAPDPRA